MHNHYVYIRFVSNVLFSDVPKCEPEDTCYYAVIGEIIRISCNVTANPPWTKVVWKKLVDKQYITIKTEVNSLHLENTSITSTLSFDDISEQESGEYFCFATNDFGTSKSKLISLNCEDTGKFRLYNFEKARANICICFNSILTVPFIYIKIIYVCISYRFIIL